MTDLPTGQPAEAAPVRACIPWWVPQMRDILAVLSTCMFGGMLFAKVFSPGFVVDPDLKGAIVLQWGLVMGWYFGSSKASSQKDDTISAMAKGNGQ